MSNWVEKVSAVTGAVTLGLKLANDVVIPLVSGTIRNIHQLKDQGGEEIEYVIVLKTGRDNLDSAGQNFKSALEKINAERAAAGQPPLDIPELET